MTTSPNPTPPLRNADHRQLRDVAVERLRAMIAQGKLRGGEWLRQGRLATELGISFTPIREALKQLEAEGLVEHVPYRGVRVVEFRPEDALDIYAIRALLESEAAASAALHMTEDRLAALYRLHEEMAALSGPESLPRVRELNEKFHLCIAEASQRPYLIKTLRAVWMWYPTMLWSQFLPAGDPANREEADNEEHAAILKALAARDGEQARNAMRYHIERARQTLVEALNR